MKPDQQLYQSQRPLAFQDQSLGSLPACCEGSDAEDLESKLSYRVPIIFVMLVQMQTEEQYLQESFTPCGHIRVHNIQKY